MNSFFKITLITMVFFFHTLYSKTIKISFAKNLPPYYFIDKDKNTSGLLIDYWNLWAEKVNVDIEFIPASWPNAIEKIKTKEVDIHAGLLNVKERKPYLDYVGPIAHAYLGFHVNIKKFNVIQKVSDLNGKTVAVVKNSYASSFLKEHYPKIKQKQYSSHRKMSNSLYSNKMLKAIDTDEVDAIFSELLTMWYQLIEFSSVTNINRLEQSIHKTNIYAGIKKSDKELKNLVLKGINKITREEMHSLEKKWIVDKNLRFYEKEFKNDLLSEKERNYLKNNTTKIAFIKNWEKMSLYDKKGKFSGFHVDLLKQINKNLNTNISYKVYDKWSKAYTDTIDGKASAIFGLSWSKEREKIFSYSPSYYFSPFHIIGRKSDDTLSDITKLDNKIVIIPKNSIYIKILKKNSPNIKIQYTKNHIDTLERIQNKTADFTIKENNSEYDLKKYKINIKKTLFIKEGSLHIGTSKKNILFASIINKALSSMTQEQLNTITKKWTHNKTTKVTFTKEELRYIKNSPTILIGIDEWEPLIYSNNSSKIKGLAGELVREVLKFSGLKYKVVNNKWEKLLKDLKNKKIDILPFVYYTKERSKFALYTDSYLNIVDFLFIKQDNNSINSFKDLENKILAISKNDGRLNKIKKQFPNIKIIESNGLEDSILKVINKQADALLESQIAVEYSLTKLFISGLKAVPQNTFSSTKVHMLTKKDNVLNSILDKSIYSLELFKKNEVIQKWIKKSPDNKKALNIALKVGREPYVIDKTYLKGIEYDLLALALKKNNIRIKNVKKLSLQNLSNALDKDKELDIAVSVKKRDDEYYYSKDFIGFENIAISRKIDNIEINNISDLKDKNIIAFEGASLHLNKEYKNLFSKKSKNYKEEILQEKQVKDFLDKKTDVIILDKNIFFWFLKKLSNKSIDEFQIDHIFQLNNKFKLAFRKKNLRDLFDKNFKEIKDSGKYKEIFDSYFNSDILAKVKIDTFIASLLSKYIYNNDIKEIAAIVKRLTTLKYIDKIEVYSDELIFSSSLNTYKNFSQQNSYFINLNIPIKVGSIKVFFNDKELKKASYNLNLIPNIDTFKKLKSFTYITKKYQEFDYLNKTIIFTKDEKEYMKKNPILRFTEMNWKPLSIIEKGKYSGIYSDYIKLLEKYSKLKFEFIKSNSYHEVKDKLKNKTIDIFPLSSSKEMKEYAKSSKIFSDFNYVLVMNKNNSFTEDINELRNKTFAIPKGYTSFNIIKEKYPEIKILQTKNNKEALEAISLGKADVTLIHEAVAVLNIQRYFSDLKIVGITKHSLKHRFTVHKDNTILLSIINKILKNISFKEHKTIKDKWINYKISTSVDYAIIYQIVFIFLLVLLIILYFLRKISSNKNKIEKINNKLEETINTLEKTKIDFKEQKDLFEALFKGTSDGLLLLEDNKVIHANNSYFKMYCIKDMQLLKNINLFALAPSIQPNGNISSEIFRNHIRLCKINNYTTFEILAQKTTKETFWVNIILIKIETNNRKLIYSITRDITQTKALEEKIQNNAIDLELSNDELEDSNEELQTTISNLKQTQEKLIDSEKMASLGALVAGVAHEINTPVGIGLTGITHLEDNTKEIFENYSKEDMTQEEFEDYLKIAKDLTSLVHKNLEKAASLVRSFKQVAVDQSSEEKRVFNVKEYLDEILKSIHSVTKKTNLKIQTSCQEDININSYAGAYSQIITNLIMNSITHGFKVKEEGLISINITKENNEIKIIYKDSGKGIKEENLNKIFDPFFTTNRDNGGSGLGLNIIYNIITSSLNGSIKCYSKEKEGVKFIITLNT